MVWGIASSMKRFDMNELAKILIFFGGVLVLIGAAILVFHRLPFLGRLPGDIIIKRDNFTFYFPITTGIVLSIILSIILYLVGRFR